MQANIGYGKGILECILVCHTWYYGHSLKGGSIVSGGIRLGGKEEKKK